MGNFISYYVVKGYKTSTCLTNKPKEWIHVEEPNDPWLQESHR